MTGDDVELVKLLAPSTFSLEQCRARSREARSPEELSLLLIGEKRVKEALAKRARLGKPSAEPSLLQARIQKGKEAAERLRATADERRDLRKSWARSSLGSAESAAEWYLRSLTMSDQSPAGAQQQSQPRLDLKSIKSFNKRYSMNSARSTASSVCALVPSQKKTEDLAPSVPSSSQCTALPISNMSTVATTSID